VAFFREKITKICGFFSEFLSFSPHFCLEYLWLFFGSFISVVNLLGTMAYIEDRKSVSGTQYYFIKRISLLGNSFAIKKYMGANLRYVDLGRFILDNKSQLVEKEFSWRRNFLPDISYSTKLLEAVEYGAVSLNYLFEAKSCEKQTFFDFSKEFIFHSNHIEGSRIPIDEVRLILEKGHSKYKDSNEVLEVKNSYAAFQYLFADFRFTIPSIKRLYYILTKGLIREGNQSYPRGFKSRKIIVGNSQTSHPDNVEKDLTKLIEWYKANKTRIHPLQLAYDFFVCSSINV